MKERLICYLFGHNLRKEGVMTREHVAWGCRTCNKIDWVNNSKQLAKPEHVAYRGIDVGTCKGEMIKLFKERDTND